MEFNFNPLAPCGARLSKQETKQGASEFQSARPVRGETLPKPFRLTDP